MVQGEGSASGPSGCLPIHPSKQGGQKRSVSTEDAAGWWGKPSLWRALGQPRDWSRASLPCLGRERAPSGGLNLPSPSKLVSSASLEFGTWTWRSWFLSLTLPHLWWDRNQLLHVQAPDCLANVRGSCLNPRETLHAVLPLGKHLELTPLWHGLLEGVTGTAGTWEQLGAGDQLVGDRLGDRRAERRSKLGRLKRWRLEGGESRGEEMHPALLDAQRDAGSPARTQRCYRGHPNPGAPRKAALPAGTAWTWTSSPH